MNPLDAAVLEAETERKLTTAELEQQFDAEIAKPLARIVEAAPVWLREIQEFAPTAIAAASKASLTRYTGDAVVRDCLNAIQSTLPNNPNSIQLGLREFKRLTPQSLLGKNGRFDPTRAEEHRNYIVSLLRVGQGCRRSLENTVGRLEAQISYLMNNDKYARDVLGVGRQKTAPVEIKIPEPKRRPADPPVDDKFTV